jgi:hypothetical protein
MLARGEASVWWPDMRKEVKAVGVACRECDSNAPSKVKEPPVELVQPEYPFQLMCADYMHLKGNQYLVLVDRYSGWPSVHQVRGGGTSKELIQVLKAHCETFGIMEEITTDGGSQFVAGGTQEFFDILGIHHRLSSSYNPHGNTRAEVGVKTGKRLVRNNVGPGGSLDTLGMGRALLQYRNTPDRDTGLSPAQVVFGRRLRDFLPVQGRKYQPRQEWLLTAERRELALARRHCSKREELLVSTRELEPLVVDTVVSVQNQTETGPAKLKWDKSVVALTVLPNSQYQIKMNGTGRVSLGNRVFLGAIIPYRAETRGVHG